MELHPLRLAYIKAIKKAYGAYIQGDKDPCKTETAARKICALGLDYDAYMDLVMKILEPLAKHFNWPYPYWNTAISDKTMAKVQKLIRLTPTTLINDNLDCEEDLFESELAYAVDYVDWWLGKGPKPRHADLDIPPAIKARVAEYLCRLWGVPFTSSNYNVICKTLETNGR